MAVETRPNRSLQAAAFAVLAVFAAGLFDPAIGMWTGAVLGAWFVGTQPPLRGLAWLAAIGVALRLVLHGAALSAGGWPAWEASLVGLLVGALPYLPYRLSQGVPLAATVALPLWALTAFGLARAVVPGGAFHPAGAVAAADPAVSAFAVNWVAATLVFLWNRQRRPVLVWVAAGVMLAIGWGLVRLDPAVLPALPSPVPTLPAYVVPGAIGGLLILAWSVLRASSARRAAPSPDTLALLRSPATGQPLQLQDGALVSAAGERFAIRRGIAQFVDARTLGGLNRKYNRLYQTIGGFYDDFQRAYFALVGIDRRAYFMQYLGLLEVEPGDRVLETSVGTALNFFYLPRGLELYGLDLSAEMLANADAYLARQHIPARLFLGNAEALPFADDSMDAVFHCGGINFFDDKAKAIREMIRVAKPGSRLLIADETEKLVKKVYERTPVTGGYFKGRDAEVSTPVALLPPGMEEVEVRLLRAEEFYALTFRKPARSQTA